MKAAATIYAGMQAKAYSTETWSSHELHPKAKDESTVDFIFTMDLLNFCFWSESGSGEMFAVDYRGQRWTGYWSLVALLQRALDEGGFVRVAARTECSVSNAMPRHSNNLPVLLGRRTNLLGRAPEICLPFLQLDGVGLALGTLRLSTASWQYSL